MGLADIARHVTGCMGLAEIARHSIVGCTGLADIARYVSQRIVNPRLYEFKCYPMTCKQYLPFPTSLKKTGYLLMNASSGGGGAGGVGGGYSVADDEGEGGVGGDEEGE